MSERVCPTPNAVRTARTFRSAAELIEPSLPVRAVPVPPLLCELIVASMPEGSGVTLADRLF
jgi:hypothetical protein